LKSGNDFKEFNDVIKNKLQDSGLREKRKDDKTYLKDGQKIDEKEAPDFYERSATIVEYGNKKKVSASYFEGSKDWGDWGSGDIAIGKAEAYAGWSAGLYVLNADGTKKFSPGVKAECGASITAMEVNYKNQVLGDENLGVNVGAKVVAGQASLKGEAVAQLYNEDGRLDMQLDAGVSAEAIAGKLEGSAAVNVLGGSVGVTGSVSYGIGAHANVGYKDGVFKFDIGATLGVGASIGAEIDVGGMVNTVVDGASAVWDGIKKGWSSFWS
jgi:hypothetical protein